MFFWSFSCHSVKILNIFLNSLKNIIMVSLQNVTPYMLQVEIAILLSVCIFILVLYGNFIWRKKNLIIQSWNVPGPINFPFVGAAYVVMCRPEYIYSRITKLQEKLSDGGKLWFGSKLVYLISKPEQIEKILSSSRLVNKGHLLKPIIEMIGEGLLQASVPVWKKHRKIIVPTFNQKTLESFVEIFANESQQFTEVLRSEVGKDLNIYELLTRCMLDIIIQTAMGLKLDIQKKNVNYGHVFDRMMLLTYLRIMQIWNHIDYIWEFLGYKKKIESSLKIFNNLTDKVIKDKLDAIKDKQYGQLPEVKDPKRLMVFLDYLIETGKLDTTELRDEINLFLFAGTDTSASALSFAFAMLGMFPDVQDKVLQEVLQVLGPDRLPVHQDLPNLQYTERVLKETLRLFPVGAFFIRELTEDVDVGDFIIPKTSVVYFGLVYIHRNAKYWSDPLKFDPDRFSPEEIAKQHPCAYIPFSYGPRNCIGRQYAMMNMKVLISTVIRKYKIHCQYKRIEDIKLKTNIVLRFRDGAKVSLTPRLSSK